MTKQNKNRGAGLVSVIIAVAFVMILGSVVISATMSNYRMKQTNLRTKDSFYNAERALDEVRTGLQGVISQAVSNSYLQVMENYSTYDLQTKQDLMEAVFFETIWANLAENPVTHTTYSVNKLTSYLVETAWQGGNLTDGYGAILSSDSNVLMTYDDDGVVLKNLEVYFRDEQGYVSVINTDIKLLLPDLQFSSGISLTNVSEYTTIADEEFIAADRGSNQITGSLYTGQLTLPGEQSLATTTGRLKVEFSDANNIIVKNKIIAEYADLIADGNTIWANDIKGYDSNLTLGSSVNVKNDLALEGTGTHVTLNGIYNGYGNHLTLSEESSAIIINGKDAVLDLNGVSTLTLAGHAFIGTKSKDVGSPTGSVPGSGKDIYTGESITVKSNQLMYLVPPECIGVSYQMTGGSKVVGKSVYGRNPLTATASGGGISPYQELNAHPELYDMISDTVISDRLGNPLSKYIKYVAGKPQVEKVFVQTNGETLVYFYMSFRDEDAANQYFQDYYGLNKEQIEEYMDFYTNGISMRNSNNMLRRQLAGNVLIYDGITTQLQKNTLSNGATKLAAANTTAQDTFDALCTRLVFQYSELTNVKETDLTKDIVFDNIVDIATLKNFMTTYDSFTTGIPKSYKLGAGASKTLLINNELTKTYHYDGTTDADVHLIIATGNVSVDANFSGLILSDGIVTLAPGVSITANTSEVREALEASSVLNGVTWNAIGFFWDGKELLNTMGSASGDGDSIRLSDLVIYENWTKS